MYCQKPFEKEANPQKGNINETVFDFYQADFESVNNSENAVFCVRM